MGRVLCSTAVMSTLAFTATAYSQTVPPPSRPVVEDSGEIIVTAQRREQKLQDVGIAVSAYSADSLKARGLSSSSDIANLTPGVYVSGSLAGQSQQFTVRGVTQSDFNDAIEAPVAVYVDEVYIPTQQGQTLALFDLQRVEILKGPQGTLFGRNATGGLVQNVVVQPDFAEVGGYLDVAYASFNEVKAEGAINLPLSSKAALRVSGFYGRIDNFWKNVYPRGGGVTNLGGVSLPRCCENEGGGETFAGRAQLKLEPADGLTIRLTGSGARQRLSTAAYTEVNSIAEFDSQGRLINAYLASPTETRQAIGPGGVNVPLPFAVGAVPGNGTRLPGANLNGFIPPDPKDLELSSDFALGRLNRTDTWTTAAHIDYEMGNVSLASITSYQKFKKQFMMDTDGSPANLLLFGTKAKTNSWSQELRLSGDSSSLQWQAGLYYLYINARTVQGLLAPAGSFYAPIFGSTVGQGIDFVDLVHLKTRSASIFGQLSYEFAPKLTIVAGGRIIRERQTYDFLQVAARNDDNYAVDDSIVLFLLSPHFTDKRAKTLWAGKLQLEYRPQTGLLIYAGVNRGVKGGSYNAPLPSGGAPLADSQYPYKPETLYNYEAGLKYSTRGLSFSASGFYYDYRDYQAFVFENISGIVTNVNAKTYGVDADVSFLLVPGLRATLGGSYIHGRIKNYEVAPGVLRTVRPTYAPQYQADASLNYSAPWAIAGGNVSANVNVNYSSGFYYNIKNFDSTWYDGRTLVNLSASWTQGDRGFEATVFVKNVFDKRYGLIGFEGAENNGIDIKSFGMPRSVGGRLAYRF